LQERSVTRTELAEKKEREIMREEGETLQERSVTRTELAEKKEREIMREVGEKERDVARAELTANGTSRGRNNNVTSLALDVTQPVMNRTLGLLRTMIR
jgi:hypothetical protein